MKNRSPIVAGVFTQEAQARQALDAIQHAGFDYDQVGIATPSQRDAHLFDDLLALDVPRDQASYYTQEFKAGRTIVSVRPDGREREALDLLRHYGAYDFEQRTASPQATLSDDPRMRFNPTGTSAQTRTASQSQAANMQADFYQPRSLKLREERLNVTKERVQAGEVDLHKEVITEQKTIDVPVMHEEVIIERRAVSGGQVDNTTPFGEDETVRIPVNEEQVNVSKNTVVTGEVAIGKRSVQETRRVSDTVKHEEARVEREGEVNVQGDIDESGNKKDQRSR